MLRSAHEADEQRHDVQRHADRSHANFEEWDSIIHNQSWGDMKMAPMAWRSTRSPRQGLTPLGYLANSVFNKIGRASSEVIVLPLRPFRLVCRKLKLSLLKRKKSLLQAPSMSNMAANCRIPCFWSQGASA